MILVHTLILILSARGVQSIAGDQGLIAFIVGVSLTALTLFGLRVFKKI